MYRKPKFLVTCAYAVYAIIPVSPIKLLFGGEQKACLYTVLMRHSGLLRLTALCLANVRPHSSSVSRLASDKYYDTSDILSSLSLAPNPYTSRIIAAACLSFCVFVHGILPAHGLRIQNTLGLFKVLLLFSIGLSGVLCFCKVTGFRVRDQYDPPTNFDPRFFWEGSGTGVNAVATGMYIVIW